MPTIPSNLPVVWTEREGDIPGTAINEGDWEACVATAYSMGLLYGGVPMAAPYTQKQRELIEYYGAAADRDQNLDLSDIKSKQVYGVVLRKFSTGTVADALTRVGVGVCLTGTGCPGRKWSTGIFGHEIFAVPAGAGMTWLYDPLAPANTLPELISNATLTAWARPPTATAAREVKQFEFGGGWVVIRPVSEDFTTGAGAVNGRFYVEGPGIGGLKYFNTATKVTSVGESTDGLWRLLFYYNGTGATGGEYLWMARANLTPTPGTREPAVGYAKTLDEPAAPAPPAPLDCAAEVKAATDAQQIVHNAEVDRIKGAVTAHVNTETQPERDLLKAVVG